MSDDGFKARGVTFSRKRTVHTLRQILDAAYDLFIEKGYRKTRIGDINKRAGIGHGTFYLYFKNKDDLLRYMLEEFLKDIENINYFATGEIENVQLDDLDNIRLITNKAIELFDKFSKMAEVFTQAIMESPSFRDFYISFHNGFAKFIELKIEEMKNMGKCKSVNSEIMSHVLLIAASHTLLMRASGMYREWETSEISETISFLIWNTLNRE